MICDTSADALVSMVAPGCHGPGTGHVGTPVPGSSAGPLVSIVTVVRNAADDLRATIESVVAHRGNAVEYIVVDGNSDDGTTDVIRQYEHAIDFWVSEPDRGIYDAMNKALGYCSGRYILFLNAKDELVADIEALSDSLCNDYVLVYGKATMIAANGQFAYVKGKQLTSLNKIVRGTPLCHQAIFYRRDCIGAYDSSYRIIADRVLTFTLLRKYGLEKACFVDRIIANYYEGGFSRKNEGLWRGEEYRFLRSLGRHWYARYKKLGFFWKKCLSGRFG
jgi:glycosyltransferase involved in cell wall biosynthesis